MSNGVLGVQLPRDRTDFINCYLSPEYEAFEQRCNANPMPSMLDGGQHSPMIEAEYTESNGALGFGDLLFAIGTVLFVIFLLIGTVVSFGLLFSGGV